MYLTGLVLVLGALVLGGKAAYTLYTLYEAGRIDSPIWSQAFWFYTTSFRDGITPEGQQVLWLVLALVVYVVGRHFMTLGDTEDL